MNEYEYSEVQIGHKIRDAYMEVYKYKRKIMQLTQPFLKPTIYVTDDYSPSAKAAASKVSERPVPVTR